MASHAGLILVLKNKDGYIGEKGEIVNDIKKARRISFYEAGFSEAKELIKRLGLYREEIDSNSLKYETIEPSYEGRISEIEEYYREMGMDRDYAYRKAVYAFSTYFLRDYELFKDFIMKLKMEVINYYKNNGEYEEVVVDGQVKKVYIVNSLYNYEKEGYSRCKCYMDDKELYRYRMKLNRLDLSRYFDLNLSKCEEIREWRLDGLQEKVIELIRKWGINNYNLIIDDKEICLYARDIPYNLIDVINEEIRNHFSRRELHITRMFGSYILLRRKNDELKAEIATPVPIKYCPLMIKLLEEVGGKEAVSLIEAIKTEDKELQSKMMCELINRIVISAGYFDTNRPLNSCEANVLFGASETISSAFSKGILDAAVIVSNNLGTIITTNASNTQGAVKRMTGLFYTSPSSKIMETAKAAKIVPVFPYTAEIDQVEGVREAIKRGYKRIAVTLAAQDNKLLEEIKKLENNEVTIYKFGLCSTGIDELTAHLMASNADIVWSCASKYVKEYIEPKAIAQVGIKIPVHIMTKKGWELVRNHLEIISNMDYNDVVLSDGEDKPVLVNSKEGIKKLVKKDVRKCNDCPYPCI